MVIWFRRGGRTYEGVIWFRRGRNTYAVVIWFRRSGSTYGVVICFRRGGSTVSEDGWGVQLGLRFCGSTLYIFRR